MSAGGGRGRKPLKSRAKAVANLSAPFAVLWGRAVTRHTRPKRDLTYTATSGASGNPQKNNPTRSLIIPATCTTT